MLPFDPIDEAARQWGERWGAVTAMHAVTSLMRVQQLVIGGLDAILKPHGLTFARYEALVLLVFSSRGSLPLGKMGERLQVHPTSVTSIAKRLESDGLITRRPHPDDGRAVLAEITAEGRGLVERATADLVAANFTLEGALDPDLAEVSGLLRPIRERAGDFESGTAQSLGLNSMSQQPFTRRGAIDLSALKRPAAPSGPPPGGAAAGAVGASGAGGAAAGSSSYAVSVTAENFQQVVELSMTAPVLLALYSRSRMPESAQLAEDLATLSGEFEGRFIAGLVDVDAAPQIAQAMQVPSIPYVVAVLDGRPAPLLQDVVPIEELRQALTQVMQQLTAQGMTGRHQPLQAAVAPAEDGEPHVDPRYAAAEEALARNDIDTAVAEYQKLVTANPADAEAAAGLAMTTVLQRTQGVDPAAARAAARRTRPTSTPTPCWLTSRSWPARSRRRSPCSPSWCVVRRTRIATALGSTSSRCSPRSATTTHACSLVARTSPLRSSEGGGDGDQRTWLPGSRLRVPAPSPVALPARRPAGTARLRRSRDPLGGAGPPRR